LSAGSFQVGVDSAHYPLEDGPTAAFVQSGPRDDSISIPGSWVVNARWRGDAGDRNDEGNASGSVKPIEIDHTPPKNDLRKVEKDGDGGAAPPASPPPSSQGEDKKGGEKDGGNKGDPDPKHGKKDSEGGKGAPLPHGHKSHDPDPGPSETRENERPPQLIERVEVAQGAADDTNTNDVGNKGDDPAGELLLADDASDSPTTKDEAAAVDDPDDPGASGTGIGLDGKLTPANAAGPTNVARGFVPGRGLDDNPPPTGAPVGEGEETELPAAEEEVATDLAEDYAFALPVSTPSAENGLADYVPGPSAMLDQALDQFLGQVEAMSRGVCRAVQGVGAAPWVATIVLVGAAVEWTRRRRLQPRLGLAGQGGDMAWMWLTGLPGTFRGRWG
jgi:hypothetical protein